MEKYKASTYKQQGGYKSFTPYFVNQYFAWENPKTIQTIEYL